MDFITSAIMVMVSLLGGFFFVQRSFERKSGIEPQEVHTDV